jgi:hypothetical protein
MIVLVSESPLLIKYKKIIRQGTIMNASQRTLKNKHV